jgi:hypothetical protein
MLPSTASIPHASAPFSGAGAATLSEAGNRGHRLGLVVGKRSGLRSVPVCLHCVVWASVFVSGFSFWGFVCVAGRLVARSSEPAAAAHGAPRTQSRGAGSASATCCEQNTPRAVRCLGLTANHLPWELQQRRALRQPQAPVVAAGAAAMSAAPTVSCANCQLCQLAGGCAAHPRVQQNGAARLQPPPTVLGPGYRDEGPQARACFLKAPAARRAQWPW